MKYCPKLPVPLKIIIDYFNSKIKKAERPPQTIFPAIKFGDEKTYFDKPLFGSTTSEGYYSKFYNEPRNYCNSML